MPRNNQPESNPIGFLRTTAIGGLLFLLPLIVVGALIGQVVPIVLTIAETLGGILPGFVKTPGGITLLIVLAILILLALCFVCGLIARRSFARRLSTAFEKQLLLLFPRYAILKDQMADSIGGDQAKVKMKPVLIRFEESMRIGFETERSRQSGLVAVYLPGSPDPWSGRVVLVDRARVDQLQATFGEVTATCEQLGRGSIAIAASRPGPACSGEN
jgi:uncharacterized membrane protein